ncbi:MAG: hypothetical protein BGO70_13360 [Bacteroidetes bacterium 43-93]|nr:glycosyltransferase [Bacteroidota bacterium]OJW99424.1 MAG: hypothetical protein BGO70_13360 [Bacteroidetes bacterium 43-93]
MQKKPKILLVMHNIPLDSGFLAVKFIRLADEMDVHLLAWDTREKIDRFIEQYKLPADYRKRIHLGANSGKSAFLLILTFVRAFFTNKKFRKFLVSDGGSFVQRLKYSFTYLPAICLQPDVVHYEFGTLARQAELLKHATGAKMSVSFRGYDLNYAGLHDHEYYESVWEHMDGIHFLGNDLKQRAIKRGYKQDKIEAIIAPAIDTDFFKPSGNPKDNGKLVIVSVGRLVWKKGLEYGIRAMKLLQERNIAFEYRIIGEGEYRQALEFVIAELGLQDQVVLAGNKDAVAIKSELDKADIFLHPSISEGFSNAVLEAQSMGLPIVCSDADGLPENVEDGVTGLVTPKWDVEAIADKIAWLWQHNDVRKQMGEEGIKRVNTYFRQDEQIRAFVQFYNKLLAK